MFVDQISQLLSAVATETDEVVRAIIPVYNSREGPVRQAVALIESLPEIWRQRLQVDAEVDLDIIPNLLSFASIKDISTIYSHPQALGQCRAYLQELQAEAEAAGRPAPQLVESSSTSYATELVSQKRGNTAAVASLLCAQYYKVPVVAAAIQGDRKNATSFILLSNKTGSEGNTNGESLAEYWASEGKKR